MKGPHFFEKRKKEMARQEKAKQKADRKAQRKAGKGKEGEEGEEDGDEFAETMAGENLDPGSDDPTTDGAPALTGDPDRKDGQDRQDRTEHAASPAGVLGSSR